jgi:uncharacterized protein YggT (Ycf19 family)
MSDQYPPQRAPLGAPPMPAVPPTAGVNTTPRPGGDDDTMLWVLRVSRALVVLVYAIVTACLVLLALAFVLRLFGASLDAEFTQWVYRNVSRIMEPFRGIFPSPALTDRSVLDFSLLFAMIVYGTAALALHALIAWLARRIGRATAAARP